jgi:hypothetical protein
VAAATPAATCANASAGVQYELVGLFPFGSCLSLPCCNVPVARIRVSCFLKLGNRMIAIFAKLPTSKFVHENRRFWQPMNRR